MRRSLFYPACRTHRPLPSRSRRAGSERVERATRPEPSGWLLPVTVFRRGGANLSPREERALAAVIEELKAVPNQLDATGAVFGMILKPDKIPEAELRTATNALIEVAKALRARGLRDLRIEQAGVPEDGGQCAVCKKSARTRCVHVPAAPKLTQACRPCLASLANLTEVYVVRGAGEGGPC